jgi:hypothetical protein
MHNAAVGRYTGKPQTTHEVAPTGGLVDKRCSRQSELLSVKIIAHFVRLGGMSQSL